MLRNFISTQLQRFMNLLSIARLEEARKNPLAVAEQFLQGKTGSNRITDTAEKHLINAIRKFQKHSNLEQALKEYDLGTANAPVDSMMAKKKNDVREYLKVYASLSEANGFKRLGNEHRIRYAINPNLIITGNVPALLKDDQGRIVTLFLSRRANPRWYNELRFPFVQKLLHRDLANVPNNGFEVGIFTLEDCKLDTKAFSEVEINNSMDEILSIADVIIDFINTQKALAIRTAAISNVLRPLVKQLKS